MSSAAFHVRETGQPMLYGLFPLTVLEVEKRSVPLPYGIQRMEQCVNTCQVCTVCSSTTITYSIKNKINTFQLHWGSTRHCGSSKFRPRFRGPQNIQPAPIDNLHRCIWHNAGCNYIQGGKTPKKLTISRSNPPAHRCITAPCTGSSGKGFLKVTG